jgi:hypothetical protein
MRKALIVGINEYDYGSTLNGCVNDATKLARLLGRNEDGSINFENQILLAPPDKITKQILKEKIEELFKYDADIALLYFSGHGSKSVIDGYLVAKDTKTYDDGLSMHTILSLADKAPIREIVIILDCCFSGTFGSDSIAAAGKSILREGISILTASGSSQTSKEVGGAGVFTSLICDALEGGAADVCGLINVAGLYTYVDQTLGAWDQRPMLKANVSKLISVRQVKPQVEMSILRTLEEYFPNPNIEYSLDPSYEKTAGLGNLANELIFSHLQQYRDSRLLIPVNATSMFEAAMNSKSCRLTPLGRFYAKLVMSGRL